MEENYNISTVSGDSYELNIIYKDSNGDPIDLTDYGVYFQTRKNQLSNNIEFDKLFTISAEDGVLGLIKFTLTPYETETLTVCSGTSKYVYGLRLTSPDGFDVKTILSGTLEVEKGVI